jgi:hypothetical protein
MKDEKNIIKIICYIGAVTLFVMSFLSLVLTVYGDVSGQDDFILPEWGGGMVHCDPQMSDNIRLQVPITNVSILWYRHDLGGELIGTLGIGIAGNSRIAASTFGPWNVIGNEHIRNDNLIFYDYYGNHIWSSGWWSSFNNSEYPWS